MSEFCELAHDSAQPLPPPCWRGVACAQGGWRQAACSVRRVSPLSVLLLPGAFQAVTSHQGPRTQPLRGQALSPRLLRRKKDVFGLWSWTSKLLLKSMRVSDNMLPFSFQKYPVVREMRRFCTQDSSICSTRKYTKLETNKQIKWSDIKHIRMIAWGVKRRRAGVVGGNGELGWEINKPRE